MNKRTYRKIFEIDNMLFDITNGFIYDPNKGILNGIEIDSNRNLRAVNEALLIFSQSGDHINHYNYNDDEVLFTFMDITKNPNNYIIKVTENEYLDNPKIVPLKGESLSNKKQEKTILINNLIELKMIRGVRYTHNDNNRIEEEDIYSIHCTNYELNIGYLLGKIVIL